MKRTQLIAVCILLLCSLLLIVNAGTVMAYNTSYSFLEYTTVNNAVTIDGKWTAADEWHDAKVMDVGPTPNVGKFMYKIITDMATYYNMTFCLEFADSTNNPGDRWQICVDGPASASATAPNATSYKIEIEGHTTLKVYKGTGTAWATTTTTAVTWSNTLATSPHDPANHYICEIQFDKMILAGATSWAALAPGSTYGAGPYGVRVAMYDDSKPSQGWVSWPPASTADNPSTWGIISDIAFEAAPEGLTFPLMVVVSAVAVLSTSYYLRKRPKI